MTCDIGGFSLFDKKLGDVYYALKAFRSASLAYDLLFSRAKKEGKKAHTLALCSAIKVII